MLRSLNGWVRFDLARERPERRPLDKGGAGSRTGRVEGPRLHKRGFASAEDGEVPPRTPEGILDAAGGVPLFCV